MTDTFIVNLNLVKTKKNMKKSACSSVSGKFLHKYCRVSVS